MPVVAFATDATRPGRRDGHRRAASTSSHAYDLAVRERAAGHRPVALRRRPARRGRRVAARRRPGLRRHDPRLGRVPQISVVLGPAAGGAAYGPALTDIVIMSEAGRIFVTGPDVVRSVTGEQVDMAALGGPEPHGKRSGVVHVVTKTDDRARCVQARRLAVAARPPGPGRRRGRRRRSTSPACCRRTCDRAYDVKPLVNGAARRRRAWSCTPSGRRTSSTTLGRLGGRTVGVIANNPLRLGGCLDSISRREGRPVRADVRLARRAAGRRSSTSPATCPASARSTTAWSAAAPSCCTPSPRPSCRGSPW